jgi:Domain of unknown function (DUF5658)
VTSPTPAAILWRWFWVLAALQAADLATTHLLIASGGREGNIFMREIVLTPIAPAVKVGALIFVAALIFLSSGRGRPRPRRLLVMLWVVCAAYVWIVGNNIVILLSP